MSAAGAAGDLSDSHRDHIIALLREHYAVGRFDVEEFGRRVEILLSAATAADAITAVADLPPLTESAAEPHRPWWRRLRVGRHAQSDVAAAGWLPTRERFRDPSSGRLTRVWVDPATGSRHYVPEDGT